MTPRGCWTEEEEEEEEEEGGGEGARDIENPASERER